MKKTLLYIDTFLKNSPQGCIVVTGPTASGKTGLAIRIAQSLGNAEVINCDSRQVYTDMPIITAAPTKEEQEGIIHHLFEFLSPEKTLNVIEWRELAEKKIEELLSKGKTPILCGGTGLWINALTKNFSIQVPPNEKLRKDLEKFSSEKLWEMLDEKDAVEAKKISVNNKKYIIRALEICDAKGNKSENAGMLPPKFDFCFLAITYPRQKLYNRINHRTELMFEGGVLSEVQKMIKKYPNLPTLDGAFIAHGVPEIMEYNDGKISLETVQEKMAQNTRNYAKRQMTWHRKDSRLFWIDGDSGEENIDITGY